MKAVVQDHVISELPLTMTDDRRIGAYRIEATLGQGGMGEVYLARDERLGRYVALKRIRADLPVDDHRRARFRREARAVARLSHPAIVQIYDLLETDDGDCLVMERVEGTSLREAIARGEIDAALALRLGTEIADGLAEAHAKGLVHRDLKPGNVIVTPSGHAKILDFGLARMLWSGPELQGSGPEEMSAVLTQAGALVGTVHAMSPEQASGRPLDHRGDLFALGGLLYEMLAGKAPFFGDNVLDTLRRVTSEDPEPLAELRPELPSEVVGLVERLLAKDPDARPPNARVVADELERLRTATVDGGWGRPLPAGGREGVGEVRGLSAQGEGSWGGGLTELPTGAWPLPAPAGGEASPETVVRTLLLVELCGRELLYRRHSEAPVVAALARSDRRLRDLVAVHGGVEVEKGETFAGLFERPMDAVSCALAFHRALPECSADLGSALRARAAVHLGEIVLRRNSEEDVSRGARPLEIEGSAKVTAARLLSLAEPGQTLTTHGAFDLARRAAGAEESSSCRARDAEEADDELRWLDHGRYFVDAVDEPLDVCEVGFEGLAPLAAPQDSDAGRRVLSPSEERMLGWRPAVGQTIPRREHWTLRERVGEGGFGEVWLARHKSGERRVFKFCFEAERLRALKREVTLFRLLKETLGHRDDIGRIFDWHFDAAPYFVESEYTEGGNLVEWADEQGGLREIPLETRLTLIAEIAEALGAAHSVGILHKDVKPENVLVTRDREGRPRARLTDFGIGLLTERQRLEAPGFTALGFTETVNPTDSGAGTLGYLAPELVEGKAATVQADVYSLGVLLYQMAAGDFSRSLAPGWRRDVDDEILTEDVALFTDGVPERRPASALEVAERIRTLDERRREREEAEAQRQALERSQRRRRLATTVASVALMVLAIVAVMAVRESRARRDAEASRERATLRQDQAEDLIGFMLGDLRDKLASVERLEILDEVGDKALEYFAAVPVQELSDDELARRSQALYQIGDVRSRQGRLDDAVPPLEESLALARALVARDPEDPQRLFDLGQSHFWLGSVRWQQGRRAEAAEQFLSYYDLASRLVERQPDHPDWQMELGYASTNLGVVHEATGNLAEAAAAIEASIEVKRNLAAMRPGDPEVRSSLANAYSWLARIARRRGDLRGALAGYLDAHEVRRELLARDPGSTDARFLLATIHSHLAQIRWFLGQEQPTVAELTEMRDLVRGLVAFDPENASWRQDLAVNHRQFGEVYLALRQLEDAGDELRAAESHLVELEASTSAETPWRGELGRIRLALGETAFAAGDLRAARLEAQDSIEIFAAVAEGSVVHQEVASRFGRALLLLGEIENASGHVGRAREAWTRAAHVLEPSARGSSDPVMLDPWARVLTFLGKRQEAAAIVQRLAASGYARPGFAEFVTEYGIPAPRP